MYRIVNVINGMEYTLHDQRDRKLTVLEPKLTLTINKTGILEFQIPEEHMYCGTLKKLKSAIRVIEDGELIYEGRMISDESDFYNTKSITCEGCLAFFLDSVQRPFLISGKSPQEFLEQMVESHNSQVEERKRFALGQVNVVDEDNRPERENKAIGSTWSVLKTHLMEASGGCLWVSYQDGKKMVNYTWDYGGYNEQEVRFGTNLLDLTKYQDVTNLFTRVIPTGADVEYKDELGETQTKTIDITSVNDGKDYLDADPGAIEEYGIITTTLNWPNITDPEKLKMKAEAYLKESVQIPETLKISALDLNYAGMNIQRFKVGRYTKVISRQHHLEKELLLSQLELYLDDPKKGSISLGGTQETFTGSISNKQANLSKTVQKVAESASAEINRKVENATQLITGGFGGYMVIDNIDPVTGKKIHPWRTLWMNTPDKNTAKNVIQINQNGFGFSTTGINGPYRNAWTIDGNFVADFITAGTMLADRIRGGILEVGGSGLGRDGRIVVKDAKDEEIGYWDKTGLHVLKGVIEGSDIIGSTIQGGYIYGAEIESDIMTLNDSYVQFGDYRISSNNAGCLYSVGMGIQMWEKHPNWNYPIIFVGGEQGTKINSKAIITDNISLNALNDRYGDEWGSVSKNIIELWDRIESLENSI